MNKVVSLLQPTKPFNKLRAALFLLAITLIGIGIFMPESHSAFSIEGYLASSSVG